MILDTHVMAWFIADMMLDTHVMDMMYSGHNIGHPWCIADMILDTHVMDIMYVIILDMQVMG